MPVGDTSIYASCSSDGTVKVWDCYRIERKFSINRSVEYCLPYLCYNLQQECLIVLSSLSSTVSFFFFLLLFNFLVFIILWKAGSVFVWISLSYNGILSRCTAMCNLFVILSSLYSYVFPLDLIVCFILDYLFALYLPLEIIYLTWTINPFSSLICQNHCNVCTCPRYSDALTFKSPQHQPCCAISLCRKVMQDAFESTLG